MTANKVLVTGATGHVGGALVTALTSRNVPVRALIRSGGPPGVELARGDLTDPDSVQAALRGVDAVFLLWPFFTAEGAEPVVRLIAEHAARVVYLSAMSAPRGMWGDVERLIEAHGPKWTFLRAGGFATNTLVWADQIRAGAVHWPYGDAARSLIHERDIAEVAARALTSEGHVGERYVLTGPEAVTQSDQVRIIGEAVGRPVRWVETPPEAARPGLVASLGDESFADGALAYWATLVDHPEPVTDTVRELTGRPALTFREWAGDHAEDFR
jgi:uncharacterized protein YbjT (DUF2867 family)